MKSTFVFLLLVLALKAASQSCDTAASREAQATLDSEFADPRQSPLTPEDLKTFNGLSFFPVSSEFCTVATLHRTPDALPFEMKTTTTRLPMYVKFGELEFQLKGKTYRLDLYRNIDLSKKEGYEDYLFLPFKDATNGEETYGGGRFMDLRIPKSGDAVVLDFNRAYNPYCAYNHKYSCPIVPAENTLDIAIAAGVKKFHD